MRHPLITLAVRAERRAAPRPAGILLVNRPTSPSAEGLA